MSAEWQKIGGIEVCEGTDGVVGVLARSDGSSFVRRFDGHGRTMTEIGPFRFADDAKTKFVNIHCQPIHRLIECADGAVLVLSTDEVDGKPRRGAIVRPIGTAWWMDRCGGACGPHDSKHEAIAVAVAYVTAR